MYCSLSPRRVDAQFTIIFLLSWSNLYAFLKCHLNIFKTCRLWTVTVKMYTRAAILAYFVIICWLLWQNIDDEARKCYLFIWIMKRIKNEQDVFIFNLFTKLSLILVNRAVFGWNMQPGQGVFEYLYCAILLRRSSKCRLLAAEPSWFPPQESRKHWLALSLQRFPSTLPGNISKVSLSSGSFCCQYLSGPCLDYLGRSRVWTVGDKCIGILTRWRTNWRINSKATMKAVVLGVFGRSK